MSKTIKVCPVLLAEDDENDVYFLERAFQQVKIPHPIFRVADGDEAIRYLAGAGEYEDRTKFPLPGLMLLDLKMPRKNGFEVIEWVRNQPGLRRLPLVVFTSSKEQPDLRQAYDLGANTYLVKPVKFEDLVELVRAINSYWLTSAEMPDLQA